MLNTNVIYDKKVKKSAPEKIEMEFDQKADF